MKQTTGKHFLDGIETRILNAHRKALRDGFETNQLKWFVTRSSFINFLSCAAFTDRLPLPQKEHPDCLGLIDGIFIYNDPALNGFIAELRADGGVGYSITLDLSSDVESN